MNVQYIFPDGYLPSDNLGQIKYSSTFCLPWISWYSGCWNIILVDGGMAGDLLCYRIWRTIFFMFKHLVVIHGTAHLEIYRQKKDEFICSTCHWGNHFISIGLLDSVIKLRYQIEPVCICMFSQITTWE